MFRIPPFKVDYNATDEQLLDAGVPMRTIELAKQTFLRPGGENFDCKYAMAVMEAKEIVSLYALSINNPNVRHVWYPPHASEPWRGLVKNDV